MKNQDQQILNLNIQVKTRLQASNIHGVGVFAIQTIRKGERAYCNPNKEREVYRIPWGSRGKLVSEVRDLILGQTGVWWRNGGFFLSPNDVVVLQTFINHSENPNYDPETDCALRDILTGEELTENYKLMDNYKEVFPWLKNGTLHP